MTAPAQNTESTKPTSPHSEPTRSEQLVGPLDREDSRCPRPLLPEGVGDYACFSRFLKLGTVMPIILLPL
jgi:hypothetical protein